MDGKLNKEQAAADHYGADYDIITNAITKAEPVSLAPPSSGPAKGAGV